MIAKNFDLQPSNNFLEFLQVSLYFRLCTTAASVLVCSYRVFQKKVLCLINNITKAFCLISEMFDVLDEGDPNLDFDILFFSFGRKLVAL